MQQNPSLTVTKQATSDDAGEGGATGPLDHHVLELRHEETREGHGSLNDGSDALSVFLNFALTTRKVWVPQWGACREGNLETG